ncbi:hypothetical protein N0V91_005465 [Didymella pomorum]|uniref:Uncharacterized protein n=1 Tax=Didymella pomorum TaxID=749634 RepID=A0A9W9D7D8_9PLEO|nr:hypothetical protein N0V91_005465 [Didymella pomorum]
MEHFFNVQGSGDEVVEQEQVNRPHNETGFLTNAVYVDERDATSGSDPDRSLNTIGDPAINSAHLEANHGIALAYDEQSTIITDIRMRFLERILKADPSSKEQSIKPTLQMYNFLSAREPALTPCMR